MSRSLLLRALLVVALLWVPASQAFSATLAFAPSEDQVPQWVQSADAATLVGPGYLGQRYVRLEDGGSVATYLTTSALANAMYGMTAGLAIFAPTSSWTLEVFAGGAPEASSTTPAGSTLLISASGTLESVSSDDDPQWTARGTGFSRLDLAPAEGTPVWLRVRAVGGALGVDSILGVENADALLWFPGEVPTRYAGTNWDFEITALETPEPLSAWLVLPGLLALFAARRRA